MSDAEDLSCPRCSVALRVIDFDEIPVAFCSVCRGGFTSEGTLEALLDHPLDDAVMGPAMLGDMDECPRCASPVLRNERPETTWMSCASCDGAWLEAGVMSRVQAERPARTKPPSAAPSPVTIASRSSRPMPASSPPIAEPSTTEEPALIASRLAYDIPLIHYLALPVAAFLGLLLGVVGLARPLVFIVQIWFHEVGHAIPAWLSSRAALPLPFGFTFWREESSWFTGLCVLFLIGVLGVTSFRERRPYGVVAAAVLLGFWAYLTLVFDSYAAIGWIIFGGLLGELVLSTVAIVSFYYRAPDRLRWDFWRFIVLFPAACVFASSFAMWIRIERGTESLPLGSIIGAPGDGTGDIERMLAGYAWTAETLTTTYRSIGTICLLVIVAHYAFFAIRARVAPRTN